MRVVLTLAVATGAALLAACSGDGFKPPFDPGVCYHVVPSDTEGEVPRLNVVARDQPQIEHCAARLEAMRLDFLRVGGSNTEIIGAYQGQFIFIERTGVSIGKSLTGSRYFALARTGDGRLAIPGAIQRDIDGRPVGVIEAPPTAE